MKECENCGIEHDGKYGSGRFCSKKCARSFSTKRNRNEINAKRSLALKGTISHQKGKCSVERINVECYSNKCSKTFIKRITSKQLYCSKNCATSFLRTNLCKNIDERKRMSDIGRKGGFGTKGILESGIRYDSLVEKTCFEILEKFNIRFEPHKKIPNSSKISDVYLNDVDVWVEIDGIDREYRKEWLDKNYISWRQKLKEYEEKGLTVVVVLNVSEFEKILKTLGYKLD